MRSAKGKFTARVNITVMAFIKPVVLLLCMVVSSSGFSQNIPEPPNPPRLVNDFAHLMSDEQVQALETKLDRYNDSTSTQIAIVTIETLGGAEVGSFAAELGEKWGVGTKKNHNGLVILVAKQEHKVSIRTGYGVEEKLGAIICDRIIKETLAPDFKSGNYYEGFDDATTEMIQRLAGTYQGTGNHGHSGGIPLWAIIAILLFLLFVLPRFFGGGGNNGTFGGGGFAAGLLGGFLGSGGGESGGGDSGGFGGFGGGGFSGGGASGDW